MKKIKKSLLGIGTVATAISPIAFIISCGNNESPGDNWHGSHRDVVSYLPTNNGENPWYGRPSKAAPQYSYVGTGITQNVTNGMQFGLFSLVKQDIDRFNEVQTNNAQGMATTEIISSPNRTSKLAFEAIKEVVLTYSDGTSIKFDNDSVDSTNDSSINGNKFLQDISAADANGVSRVVDIKFVFRDDLSDHHWIQQTTGKKGAPIKAEDFWTAIQIEIMRNDSTRANAGGSQYINTYVNKIIKEELFHGFDPNITPSSWLNSQIINGLKASQFEITPTAKNNFILNNGKAIHFAFNGNQTATSMSSFWKDIQTTGGLKAIPTQAVDNLKINNPVTIDVFQNAPDPKKELDDYQKSDLAATGIIEFFTAFNETDHYVAGKYYLSYNGKKRAIFKQNQDYIDDHWLNLKNKAGKKVTLNTYTIEFFQESDSMYTIIQKAFEQGFSVAGNRDGMSESDYQKALNNPRKYGIQYSTGYTSSKLLGDYSNIQFLPNFPNKYKLNPSNKNVVISGDSNKLVFFNDNYAKVMWGDTIANLHKPQDTVDDNNMNGDWADQAFAGTGMQFISNLLSAQNWFTVIRNYDQSYQESTTSLPPEGPINGIYGADFWVAHPPNNPTSPTEVLHERLRSRIGMDFYDNNGTNLLVPDYTETKRTDYQNVYTSSSGSALNRYGAPSAQLAKYKANITEALDKAGIGQNEKVTWEMPIGRGLNSIKMNIQYKKIQEFIRSLDQRLNPVAKMSPYREDGINTSQNEVIQSDYDQDFNLNNVGSGGSYEWISRLRGASTGYNVSSLKISDSYSLNSLAGGIYEEVAYLQSGFFLALSYYADHTNLMSGNSPLKGLQVFIDSFNESKDQTFAPGGNWTNEFISSNSQDFINALENFDFAKLWDNPSSVIASYDYKGLNGFGDIRALEITPDGLTPGTDLNKDLRTFMDLFNTFFVNAKYKLDEKINQRLLTDNQLLEAAIAYNIIQPGAMNPFNQYLSNRDNPKIVLYKNWFTSGGSDSSYMSDISWARVDSDPGIYLK